MADVLIQTAQKMHAHVCQKCAANGKRVVWIHPDTCRGNIAVHTCPECGEVQWKQDAVESAKLPQAAQAHQHSSTDWNTVLGYVLLFVGLSLLGFGAYQYIKDRRGKVLPLE